MHLSKIKLLSLRTIYVYSIWCNIKNSLKCNVLTKLLVLVETMKNLLNPFGKYAKGSHCAH